ncbi:MAG: endonuclease domain-containing protein [Fimbriimonadales bacterium]
MLRDRLQGERFDGLRFRFQFAIEGYIVDFVCLRARTIIELDGWSHDDTFREDLERQHKLEEEGFVFLRFSNMEVIRDCDAVAESISAFCVERARILYGEEYSKRRSTAKKRADPPLTPPGAGGE